MIGSNTQLAWLARPTFQAKRTQRNQVNRSSEQAGAAAQMPAQLTFQQEMGLRQWEGIDLVSERTLDEHVGRLLAEPGGSSLSSRQASSPPPRTQGEIVKIMPNVWLSAGGKAAT